jgi:hypothetical protein
MRQVLNVNDAPLLVGMPVGLVPEEYNHRPNLPFRPLHLPIYSIPFHDDDEGDAHTFALLGGNVGAVA